MRLRLLILFLLVIPVLLPLYIQAQEITIQRSTVIESYKGKPFYIHFVSEGETLPAIAKAYNVTSSEIIAQNPTVENGLKADMVLRIPQKSSSATTENNTKTPEPEKEQTPAKTYQNIPDKNDVPQKALNKSVEILKDQNKPAEIKSTQNKPTDEPDYTLYLVKKQETLYGISKQFNITVQDILDANPGFDGLKEGMKIKIPNKKAGTKTNPVTIPTEKVVKSESVPDEIEVKTGETLYSLGKMYNVSVDDLIDLNPQLSSGLKAGMVLKLRKTDKKNEPKPELTQEKTKGSDKTSVANSDCFNSKNIDKTYDVALLLPLVLEESSDILDASTVKDPSTFESFNYFQFYAGFMLAADSLEQLGLHARIQVLDAERLNDTLIIRQTLRKPGLDKMNLLVGPLYAPNFSIAARFAQKHAIGIVNPLSRREGIVDGNPFVIKSQVAGSGIADKLASYISNNYPDANVIAVRNDTKEFKNVVDDFTARMKAGIADKSFNGTLQESLYSTEFVAGVTKKLKSGEKNIVILFSNNKTTVPNFVSLLNPTSKSNDIILIGMDGWDELSLETEFLVNLNFQQVTSDYIDYSDETTKLFISKFRKKYGAMPLSSQYAFLGYDIGWYFLSSLMWYGDKYLTCLPDHQGRGLQYNFNFKETEKGDGFQNQDVNIVKVSDYKMVKVE